MRQLREKEEAALIPVTSHLCMTLSFPAPPRQASDHRWTTGSKEDPRLAYGCHSPLCYLCATLAGHLSDPSPVIVRALPLKKSSCPLNFRLRWSWAPIKKSAGKQGDEKS